MGPADSGQSADGNENRADHLAKLEALFSGGGDAGAAPATKVTPSPARKSISMQPPRAVFANPRKSIGRAPSEYRLRMERLKIARSEEDIVKATDAFRKHHQLPDDPEVLLKVLQHTSESVLREAMGQVSSLIMQNRWHNIVLLRDRLENLQATVQESGSLSFVNGLLEQLEAISDQ